MGGRQLFEAFDPTAASVAAAHWLKAAVDVVGQASGLEESQVLPAADDIEALPYESPAEVLSLLEFSRSVYQVIVEMVADAMLVAEGLVADFDAIAISREQISLTTPRTTLPSRCV